MSVEAFEGFVAADISLIFVDSVGYFRTLVQLLEGGLTFRYVVNNLNGLKSQRSQHPMLLNNQALGVPETFTVLDIFRSKEGVTPPLQYAFQSYVGS